MTKKYVQVKELLLKCIGCKHKEERDSIPLEMLFCPKCGMPLLLAKVKASKK